MGIENRDYTRDRDYTGALAGWGLDYVSPVVKWIIAVNVVVFVLQILLTRSFTQADQQAYFERLPEAQREMIEASRRQIAEHLERQKGTATAEDLKPIEAEQELALDYLYGFQRVSIVQGWLELDTRKVLRGQVWRLVTYAFCHDRLGVWHIVINIVALFWFGVTLESMYGPREFLLFYLGGAVVAAAAQIGIDLALGSSLPAVGASGAVLAVAMLYALHYPRNTIRVFWFWPVEVRWVVLAYAIFNLHPLLLALAGEELYAIGFGGTSHAGHLGGLAFGFLYWRFGWNLERWWERLPLPRGFALPRGAIRSKPLAQTAGHSPEQQFETDVDRILEKISTLGAESLTPQERRILELASQRYKRRRS